MRVRTSIIVDEDVWKEFQKICIDKDTYPSEYLEIVMNNIIQRYKRENEQR